MEQALEREVKLGAWPGFVLPDLGDLPGGVRAEPAAERDFDTAHYDTSDLRLARSGITVRYRSDERPAWTVKFPESDNGDGDGDGDAIVRRELRFEGDRSTVPAAVAAIVSARRRTAPLELVAELHTRRRRLELRDAEGDVVGEVDDDEVSVVDPTTLGSNSTRIAARFREVEAEVAERAPGGLLESLVARLLEAGAGAPDPTPKVMRALGPRALAPPDLAPIELDRAATGADVVRAAIASATARIVEHDVVVRLDTDHEGVHQMRVGARRLRSDLRTLAPLLRPGSTDQLREELRWLGGVLGPVRDADVLATRLQRQTDALPEEDRPHALALLRRLDRDRAAALAEAHDALAGERYAALLESLIGAARRPPVSRSAATPASESLPPLVRRAWDRLDKSVRGVGDDPTDDELHRIRIRAKRARYAAEVAAPVVGKPARRFAARLAELQDVLGGHQDGAVAEEWLRTRAKSLSRPQAVVAGELVAIQRAEAYASRAAWHAVWKVAARKKLRAWFE